MLILPPIIFSLLMCIILFVNNKLHENVTIKENNNVIFDVEIFAPDTGLQ